MTTITIVLQDEEPNAQEIEMPGVKITITFDPPIDIHSGPKTEAELFADDLISYIQEEADLTGIDDDDGTGIRSPREFRKKSH